MNPLNALRHPRVLLPLLGLLALSAPSAALARASFLEPATLVEKIKKQIAKQTVKKDFDLFEGEVLDGVSAAVKYKYKAEPSYMESYYTRYDSYAIEAGVNPAAWVEDLQLPFGLGFSAGSEVVFARQFKKQFDAVKALPYTLYHLPASAERAIEKLEVGDFVSFQTHLGLVVSVGASIPAGEFFAATGSTHASIHGNFMVHLFKAEPKKVRVKFIALRGHGKGANAGVNATLGGLKITGLKIVDNKIVKTIVMDPVALSLSANDNEVFLVDYVLDLAQPEVAAAYDRLMREKMRFKASALLNPMEEREALEQSLVTDLTEVEQLFLADRAKPEEARRVDRVFKGSNSVESTTKGFKFGLNVLRFEKGSYYAQNKILSVNDEENPERFLFDTFSLNSGVKFLFKLFDRDNNVNANLLFQADENYKPERLVALVLSRERRMQSLSTLGVNRIKDGLRQVLPDRIFRQIEWKDWDYDFGERVNVSLQHQISFGLDSLGVAERLSAEEIEQRVHATLRRLGVDPDEPQYLANGEVSEQNPRYKRPEIDFIVASLTKALDGKRPVPERHAAFVELKNTNLFIELGAPILFGLLPEERLEDLVHYKLILTGKSSDRIEFQFGRKDKDSLYDSLLYIQGVLNNRSIDLRTYKE